MSQLAALLAVASVLTMRGDTDAPAFAACRTASLPARGCVWRHGVLSANNGWYSSRLGLLDGKAPRMVAVYQPGQANPTEFAPAAAAAILARSPNLWQAEGQYLVCPLRQPRNDWTRKRNHLSIACLAGAKAIRVRRR